MQKTQIKTYKGSQEKAIAAFQADAEKMFAKGYVPTTQAWVAGSYGCGSFILALLLCFVFIGFLIFVYMLIVKPEGTLTVTYAYQTSQINPSTLTPKADEKTCPQCAERIKAAAKVCRYCSHKFS